MSLFRKKTPVNHGTLLFEIQGIPLRRFLKKINRYFAVYSNGIHVVIDENVFCEKDRIFNIYIKEPVIEDINSRTTVIEFDGEDEQRLSFEFDDETFPGLSEQMERLLENEWSDLLPNRAYTETVKWIVACSAVVKIAGGLNPHVFGSAYKGRQEIAEQRELLYNSWGFETKSDLLDMLPQLLNGRAVMQYREKVAGDNQLEHILYRQIAEAGGERCLWSWDLQRLIFLCNLGYASEYLTWEEALAWSLKAAKKLQQLYKSWDEFMHCYLLGYCFWSGESMDDPESQAFERKRIYERYKNQPGNNPWSVRWDAELQSNG
jgi:hypothetical protein